jgi:hypothetical protein
VASTNSHGLGVVAINPNMPSGGIDLPHVVIEGGAKQEEEWDYYSRVIIFKGILRNVDFI